MTLLTAAYLVAGLLLLVALNREFGMTRRCASCGATGPDRHHKDCPLRRRQ